MSSSRDISRFTAIFAAGTMLSRVLGLVRDMAYPLLPQESRAAFITAFRLPNMLRDLVGEGASNAAFVPVFTEVLHTRSEEEFRSLVSRAMGMMLVLLTLLTTAGVLLTPFLLYGLDAIEPFTGAKQRPDETVHLLVALGRWTFPYLFFIGMSVFAMGALFTVRHYSTPSWSPVLLNISLIACIVLLRDQFTEPAYALVVGVWIGGITQLAVMLWALRKHAGVLRPRFRLRDPGVLTILALLGPVIVGQAAGEVNKLVDTMFAYNLGDLAVDALYFSNRLVQLPLSIFGMATAAAVLPAASAAAARQDKSGVREVILVGMRQTSFLILPSMMGLILLGEPIARLLFEYRHFGPEETIATGRAVAIAAAGLLAFAWVKVVLAGFYAVKDTRTPVIISSACMLLNIVLNILFIKPFGYMGLAAATTIAYVVNFSVLYLMLCKRYGRMWDAPFGSSMVRMLTATAAMTAVAYTLSVRLHPILQGDTVANRFILVAAPLGFAAAAYFALCRLMDLPELNSFVAIVRRKLK
ncbi:MAG: hypothetical protein AMXMBFR84_29580 [Candidatus Hydrogenedentota bacterium]